MYKVKKIEGSSVVDGGFEALQTDQTVWVDFTKPTEEELSKLESHTKIPSDHIKKLMSGKKRPQAINMEKYSVITFLAPVLKNSRDHKHLNTEPCVLLISNDLNDCITIHQNRIEAIDEFEGESIKTLTGVFSKGATYITLSIINEVIEHYFEALDKINETVHAAEEVAINPNGGEATMQHILDAKKTLIYFHKSLLANREVLTSIEQGHMEFMDSTAVHEFRGISSSVTQLIEINSTYRDILNTATEIHLTAVSNAMNMTMKRITGWGAIILVPSLIAGIFGMNFKYMGFFDHPYGTEITIGAMAVSVVVLYWYFRKKDWM